ncbi:MAG: hypothetical protein JWS10_3168, partial [Cypionkella sp.]|nr:hypothetical protein [Cypionkella sp.]MDB5660553.1 hypothetical protein [Cypionkella sp.]
MKKLMLSTAVFTALAGSAFGQDAGSMF